MYTFPIQTGKIPLVMEYTNGKLTGVRNIETRDQSKSGDNGRDLYNITWEEYERYLKSISKRSRKSNNQ